MRHHQPIVAIMIARRGAGLLAASTLVGSILFASALVASGILGTTVVGSTVVGSTVAGGTVVVGRRAQSTDRLHARMVVLPSSEMGRASSSGDTGRLPARNANYVIHVSVDPDRRQLEGRERLRWRNTSSRPTREIRFYLYDNAERGERTTWAREAAGHGFHVSRVDASSIDLEDAHEEGSNINLNRAAACVAPDDGNPDDCTVIAIPLPHEVAPGDELPLELTWHATLPKRATAGGVIFAAHWFPQIAVLSDAGWVAHQFHYASDTFSDYGTFDVTIDLPPTWQIAATGRQQPQRADATGRRFVATDVRDFTWAASRAWVVRHDTIGRTGLPPVDVSLFLEQDRAARGDRLLGVFRQAIEASADSLAPYPYDVLTVVDLPWRNDHADLSFPTLLTTSTRWLLPAIDSDLQRTVAALFARHFWHQVAGIDQVDERWLSDGFSTMAATQLAEPLVARQLDSTVGLGFLVTRMFGGFVPYVVRAVRVNGSVDNDRPRSGEPLRSGETAGSGEITPDVALATLARYLGAPEFRAVMSTFADRAAFSHPTASDFFAVTERVTGRDLGWFWSQVYPRAKRFDYAVEQVATAVPREQGAPYRTSVIVSRNADGVFSGSSRPRAGAYQSGRAIDIAIEFADGTDRTEHWDGRDRTTTFEYESAAPVARVTVDPRSTLLLDRHRTNNSWTRDPRARAAATRWSSVWMIWLENLLLTSGLLV